MEGSSGLVQAPAARDTGGRRVTQAGLVVAMAGAAVVVFDLFGLGVVGLVMTVAGALLAARTGIGHKWFWGVGGGAALSVIARLAAEGAQTIGGWLAVLAAVFILIGGTLGFPTGSAQSEQ